MTGPLLRHLKRFFDERGWPYQADDAGGVLTFPAAGGNGQWLAFARAREEQGQLMVHSLVPHLVPEDRRQAVERFVTRANFGMVMGNFELDVDLGELRFKTAVHLEGVDPADALIDPLFRANLAMVDRYLPGIEAVLAGEDADRAVRAIEAG